MKILENFIVLGVNYKFIDAFYDILLKDFNNVIELFRREKYMAGQLYPLLTMASKVAGWIA